MDQSNSTMHGNNYFRRGMIERIHILDELLAGKRRRSLDELFDVLNGRLIEKGLNPIKKRTLFSDLSYLENEKDAPIHRPDKKDTRIYYFEKFHLDPLPIDEDDLVAFEKLLSFVRRVPKSKLKLDAKNALLKLQKIIHYETLVNEPILLFEETTESKGLEYLDELLSAIYEKCALRVLYKPFNKPEREWIVHPYVVKEFKNRWFLLCRVGNQKLISNIALDRIKGKIKNSDAEYLENDLFDINTYFNNLIGVSIPPNSSPISILIKVIGSAADYVLTKPIHKSQEFVRTNDDGSIICSLKLYNNFELGSHILSYGPSVEILEPDDLRKEISDMLLASYSLYKK